MREHHTVKDLRYTVCITNNPRFIDANQQLFVLSYYLGRDDVIVPGTVRLRLSFEITLKSKDSNATVVQNQGHNFVKKIVIRILGNEVLNVEVLNRLRDQ